MGEIINFCSFLGFSEKTNLALSSFRGQSTADKEMFS